MKMKKYVMALIVVAALLLAPALASAQYEHVITDAEDDVDYVINQSWTYDVERPNVDIIRVEISEGGEGVIVSLTVKGTITDAPNIDYGILMVDGEGGDYGIHYTDGECFLYVDASEGQRVYEPATSGVGTSTLSVDIALEDIFEPDSLEISEVWTYEYIDEDSEYYWDTAEPGEDDEPVNGDTNGNDETNGDFDFDFDEGIIDDILARGMMCLVLAIILPIIIIIILIVVVLKVLSKDDKGGEQPPQQQYQQPPPPSGPSQNQEQTQSGQGGTPPPPEDMNEE